MELEKNRKKWNTANPEERENAIQNLLKKYPKLEQFEYKGQESFSCGGVSNWVGVFFHPGTQMTFHFLPGDADFYMGAGEHYKEIREKYWEDLDEKGSFRVTVPPILFSRFLITEYALIAFGGDPDGMRLGDAHPIDGPAADRILIRAWAQKLGMDIPSEVEWEYACKAGTTSIFPWGNEWDPDALWHTGNTPLGSHTGARREQEQAYEEQHGEYPPYRNLTENEQKAPNAFGLLGMVGNLAEIVADDEYEYAFRNPTVAPYVEKEYDANYILRGGCNCYDAKFNRSTSRILTSGCDTGVGARLVMRLE